MKNTKCNEPLSVIYHLWSPKILPHICHRVIKVQAKYQRAAQFGNSNTLFSVAEVDGTFGIMSKRM